MRKRCGIEKFLIGGPELNGLQGASWESLGLQGDLTSPS